MLMGARSLIWVLFVVLLVPSAFFVSLSYLQLNEILQDIKNKPQLFSGQLLADVAPNDKSFSPDAFIARAKVALEIDVMAHRAQRSSALLSTRTWLRFMSLIYGAILTVIGAAFVLGRVRSSKIETTAEYGDFKASVISSSPGLILAFLGCVLIVVPNVSQQTISIDDTSSFIEKSPPIERSGRAEAELEAHLGKLKKGKTDGK